MVTGAGIGPCGRVLVATRPMMKLPAMLMISVPQGNASPHRRAAASAVQ